MWVSRVCSSRLHSRLSAVHAPGMQLHPACLSQNSCACNGLHGKRVVHCTADASIYTAVAGLQMVSNWIVCQQSQGTLAACAVGAKASYCLHCKRLWWLLD
eukprot:GHRR01006499.1.p1 GENE.GHRR01006499.1~~GHRR01006499.1.p1  ORF type:complete len:101 (-),score=18.84 GHRR01006499.1:1345-1647(-)